MVLSLLTDGFTVNALSATARRDSSGLIVDCDGKEGL